MSRVIPVVPFNVIPHSIDSSSVPYLQLYSAMSRAESGYCDGMGPEGSLSVNPETFLEVLV